MRIRTFEFYTPPCRAGVLDTTVVVFDEVSKMTRDKIEKAFFTDEKVFLLTEEDVKMFSNAKPINPKMIAVTQKGDTITLRSAGQKYTAKPEKGETFDAEKGVMICLLKMLGVSTTDILNVTEKLKIAKDDGKVIKCDKKKKRM